MKLVLWFGNHWWIYHGKGMKYKSNFLPSWYPRKFRLSH